MKKVTIADIAQQLNTTAATVSRALNDHPSISEKKGKKAIREAAARLNYKRNKVASSLLRTDRPDRVIIPSAEINFFGSVVHGIESLASEHGYNILIYQSNEREDHSPGNRVCCRPAWTASWYPLPKAPVITPILSPPVVPDTDRFFRPLQF